MTRDDPSAFAPPPAFGPFRVLHQIGVGALGPVFRTYEPTRDWLVAVKVFRLDITPEQSKLLADELSRAADAGLFHPSIVEPIAAGVEGTVAYLAEEYVAGESMDVAMRHYAPATLDRALPFLTQLAGAIDFARAAGVGHGALHLRDIFVTPDEARASGFGVVDALERVGIRAPVRRPYTAPERIAGEAWGAPADVFSLAAIGYELLTARRPAGTGEQIGVLTGETVGEHAADIRAVLARAMDEDPSRRYPSALAFASALEAVARGERVTAALRDMISISAAAPVPPPETPAVDPVQPARFVEPVEPVEPAAVAVPEVDAFDEEPPVAASDLAPVATGLADDEVEPASLFDHEPARDVGLDPATRQFAEEFGLAAQQAGIGTAADAPIVMPQDDDEDQGRAIDDVSIREPERSRLAMAPLALVLVLGLLLGFAAGYAVAGRDRSPGATPASAAGGTAPAAAAEPAGGKEFSEQAVTPPSPPPAGENGVPSPRRGAAGAPPVPGDEPPAGAAAPTRSVATTGAITVRSTPSRAPVTINGEWRGRTPLTVDSLKLGSYTVRVVQPGYEVAIEEVTLSASAPARTLALRLQRPAPAAPPGRTAAPSPAREAPPAQGTTFSGSVFVDSRPQGATIILDGKAVGKTPSRIDVAIGTHVFRLELADHHYWTTSRRVVAGEETRVTGSLERIR